MSHPEFAVSRFKNRNGVISFRVDGQLNAVRIRKNFKTREEAIAEKAALDLKALQIEAGLRPASTFLTADQLREAEAVFRGLDGRSLTFLTEYALKNYREPEEQKPLVEAIEAYVGTKAKECERTLLSMRQLRSIKQELKTFLGYFPNGPVSQFTPAVLTPYLERGKPSLKTYNNRRGLLSTFFKFAFQKDWILVNAVEKTPHHRINHRRGSAVTITAEKAAEVMSFVETFQNGALVPYFAICLFAGIRPCIRYGEITKLQKESVMLETSSIHVEPDVPVRGDQESA